MKVVLTIILAGVSMVSLDSEATRHFIGFVLIYFGVGAGIFILLHSHVLPFIYVRILDIKHIEALGTIAIYFDSLVKGNIEKYERLNCDNIAKTMEISLARAQEIIQNLKKKKLVSINDYGDVQNISSYAKKYLLKKKVLKNTGDRAATRQAVIRNGFLL